MSFTTAAADRVAEPTTATTSSTMVLINRFQVAAERDDEFRALWAQTSGYFRSCPGFVSLRLVRAVSPEAAERWVNVATWADEESYRAAHATEEFRRLVTQEGWRAFPSSPAIYELVVSAG